MLDLLSRLPRRLLLLKALSKKEILVPAYTRADGTYVPAHYKHVNYNADVGAVLSGKSSHSHKEALKKLSKVPGFKDLPAHEQHAHVLSSAQNIQTAASKAAQVSVFKKELLAGKKPKAANIAAFKELLASDPDKAIKIRDSIIAAIGMDKFMDLVGPAAMDQEATKQAAAAPKGPSADELAIASSKLQEIASGAPGMSVGLQAYKKLSGDPTWVSKNAVDRLQAVVDLWKQLQDAATASAKISTLTKKLAAGKAPSPSEMEAFAALDNAAKMKAVQAAHKKSGHKLTVEKINDLLGQGAAKAGVAVEDSPAQSKAAHFGEEHEGETLGIPGKQAKFKFEGGKWSYWTGEGWSQVKAAEWLAALNEGKDVLSKQPLEVVADPGTDFGKKNEGIEFDIPSAPYTVKFSGGQWLFKYKDTKGGKKGEWHEIANDGMVAALNSGMQYGSNGQTKEPLVPLAPQPDDGQWHHTENDPGMSGNPTLTAEGPDGEQIYIVGVDPLEGEPYSVGIWSNPEEEPEFTDFASPKRIQQFLQGKGVHPPTIELIEKLAQPGLQEGATKQGVGGLLVLKDGHWTLNNSAIVSFFHKHKIQPGTNMADAVVTNLQGMTKNGAGSVMADLVTFKGYAKMQGYTPAQINEMIEELNGAYAKVLDEDPFGGAQLTQPEEAPSSESGYSYASYLTNTSEGHNKFWSVEVDPEKATATTTWGKIGAKKPQSKTYKHSSAQAAYQAAKDAVAAKLGKGYVSKTVADGGGSPLPPPPTKKFGPANEGKVFSSTSPYGGTVALFKYTGLGASGWQISTDGGAKWNFVSAPSALATNLDKGFDAHGAPLKEEASGFGPANEGKMFEATLSTGKKVVFKFENGQWHNQKTLSDGHTGWAANVSSHWKHALDKGVDINGNPLVEVASFGIGGEPEGFGPKNEGQLFTDGSVDYKFEGGKWYGIVHGFGDWFDVIPGTKLFETLNQGTNATGAQLKPKTGEAGKAEGPQEGDLKWGVNGWLILKNGHWVKATLDQALIKLCPIPEAITSSNLKNDLATIIGEASAKEPVAKAWKKVATTKGGMPNVNLTIAHGGKYTGYAKKEGDKWVKVVGMAGNNVAHALNFLEHASKVEKAFLANKKLPEPLTAAPAAAPAVKPAPAAPAAAPAAPAASGGLESIDGWKKIGEQGGFNPGGTYTDPQGEDWYCKFPAGGAKVARNELLANKLYAAAGLAVPEVKLVTQNGKIGLASKIVTNAKQDKAALQGGKGDGLLSGFVADAWLANWDVVGNNPAAGKGWDNILFKQGIAYRIDPGGALLYGGAGGKKTAFGDKVIELDTMRDASINARTAKVFGGISQADLKASAAKVLEISDAKIKQMVEEFGPGDDAEKAALAKTLIARKADIAAKFPAVAKKIASSGPIVVYPHEAKEKKNKLDPTKLPVKPSDLPAPHDFMNWNNTGKPISDKPYVQQNIIDEKAIFDFALKGNLVALKDYKFQPVDKMTGEPVGSPKSMEQHPSQYVRQYYDSVVQYLEVVANPMAPLELPIAKNVSTVDQLSECFPAFKYGKSIASVPSNHRLGFWFGLGFVEDPQAVVPKVLKKTISQTAFDKAVAVWKKAPQIMRAFLKDVKGSGSANQPYRDGKVTDHGGRNCREVLRACYDNAIEHEEGTTIYKSIKMPKAMVDEFLKQPVGLVFQNPGSMCCSRKVLNAFGEHKLRIHYAKGAKANDNMGWGTQMTGSGSDSEQEITSLAGARFMVMSRQMVNGHLDMDLLMLPPDPTYVADLKESA